ncbi:pyridoxamine kinase [Sporomusa malonica]|uniref:pyridoxal kinase n=1 Tax=Sporomusa malonica TaxID=112901 RepID=A0A1W1ZQI2_9FIRM|nr:pyridoxamine kinase [Sporomusa malonica]SMC50656.1 pyridoxine kinase [Sporomusa malonica]
MKPVIPRVAAVHDISCVGRCSLTVIMPILSNMGIQVCPLPTAVLSTHLGGFKDVAFCDFTERMPDFYRHWKQEGITFDCIYSGFLASEQQIDTVSQFIDEFSDNSPLVLVDPVMGDEGKLYSVYTSTMQEHMKRLVGKADIITPNFTEACFLLGERYEEQVAEPDSLKDWLVRLADFGPSIVIMTGIPLVNQQIMNIGYERGSGCFWEVVSEHIPARYPGTGDVFASVLAGALLYKHGLPFAMQLAADFVATAIKTTFAAATPTREGVLLESALPWLGQEWARCRRES